MTAVGPSRRPSAGCDDEVETSLGSLRDEGQVMVASLMAGLEESIGSRPGPGGV
jgi:hypothetical protein